MRRVPARTARDTTRAPRDRTQADSLPRPFSTRFLTPEQRIWIEQQAIERALVDSGVANRRRIELDAQRAKAKRDSTPS